MAEQWKFRWNLDGFDQVRRDPAVQQLVDEHASQIAARAGRGFAWSARQGKTRYRAIVFTDTPRAMVVNARDNTLMKAIFSGEGE